MVWRKISDRKYQAGYSYYAGKAPENLEAISKAGGCGPGGHGVMTEEIALSVDGMSFEATIRDEVFDIAGTRVGNGSIATAKGERIAF